MRVIALRDGFYNHRLRKAGTEFSLNSSKEKLGSWMAPADSKEASVAVAAASKQRAPRAIPAERPTALPEPPAGSAGGAPAPGDDPLA